MDLSRVARNGAIVLCTLYIVACSGGGSGPGTGNGTVSISLMDRPVDGVTALYVTIDEVWIKPQGSGPAFQLPMTSTPITVNLLELDDMNPSILVDEAIVPADTYNFVEIKVLDDDISQAWAETSIGGMEEVDIDVPSNSIRLVTPFTVGENQAVRFLFDWDVYTGLTEAVGRGGYLLRPAFRILDAEEYGSISGSATMDTITTAESCADVMNAGEKAAAYIYEGNVVPDDIGSATEPHTTVDAVYNNTTVGFDYRVIIMPGDYTVAFTCQAASDELGVDNDIEFLTSIVPMPITVTGAAFENVDF